MASDGIRQLSVCIPMRLRVRLGASIGAQVEMLDEADGAGWALVQALVDCGRMPAAEAVQAISAKSLLMSPWFDDVR